MKILAVKIYYIKYKLILIFENYLKIQLMINYLNSHQAVYLKAQEQYFLKSGVVKQIIFKQKSNN